MRIGLLRRNITLCFIVALMLITQPSNAQDIHLDIAVELSLVDESLSNGKVELLVQMTNNAERPLTFLPWGTAMESPLRGRAFKVVDLLAGEVLSYNGRMAKRRAPVEADYVTLGPGQKVTNQLVISNAYAFCSDRKYRVSVHAEFYDQSNNMAKLTPYELVFSTNQNIAYCGSAR